MRVVVNRFGRVTLAVVAVLFIVTLLSFAQTATFTESTSKTKELWHSTFHKEQNVTEREHGVSYDLDTPPTHGCEGIVNDLQQRLIRSYTQHFKGIRYANIWGYLETENKGDAAIWSAQQILLSILGIETMEACRFLHKGCDVKKFTQRLDEHRPHSGIIMAGGGNFNDYYWEDQPSRMKMIETFTNTSVRAFPQSIFMNKPSRIQQTKDAFGKHKDLQLAARDQPSYDWLDETFSGTKGIDIDLVPDIAFMWGNRSDFRHNTPKTHDIVILARKDMEISDGNSSYVPWGEGLIAFGGKLGNLTYNKVDWKFTDTPGINEGGHKETGKNQRAWAKSTAGFELLASGRFVITDRLHGHILSTVIGVPHVLMDSKLGKNLNFHNTWTRDCDCTRIATSMPEAFSVARKFFERERGLDKKGWGLSS